MGEEIEFENDPKWSNFRLSWAPDLDLGSGHGHYLFSSLIEYYLYTKFHRNQRNFVDGRTCEWTDGRTEICHPIIVLGRLPKFGSRPKKNPDCGIRTRDPCGTLLKHAAILPYTTTAHWIKSVHIRLLQFQSCKL